jgi:hypothetical protein
MITATVPTFVVVFALFGAMIIDLLNWRAR